MNLKRTATLVGLLALLDISGAARAAPLSEFLEDDPKPARHVYKTVDSTPLELDAFSPADFKQGERRPAVVCIHGGAWLAGDAKGFFSHARYFASRGAIGISLEYRLLKATPTGPALADCFADCKSAMRYIRAHAADLGVDPDRIAVLGDSAGGHLAAALGTCSGFDDPHDDLKISALPNAMVLCNPIVDMTEGSWIKFIIRGEALSKKPSPEALIPNEGQLKLARELSPLFHVKPGLPPTLLMHGLDDHVVSPEQASKFAAAMQASHDRCDLDLIDGARHAFIMPRYTAPEPMVVDAIRKADQFLASLGWLSGEPTLQVSDPPAWTEKPKGK